MLKSKEAVLTSLVMNQVASARRLTLGRSVLCGRVLFGMCLPHRFKFRGSQLTDQFRLPNGSCNAVRRLLAAHDVPVDNLSIKEYQTTKLHSCESYARVPSNISSSPAAALSSSCGEQRAPPNQSESLPSIEPLPGRLPAQQRSVSFVEEGAQNIVFSPHLDDTKSEASMVSPLFEMHNVWRRLHV